MTEDGELTSACTCPYGLACKHAVAVLLEYLEYVEHEIEITTIGESDQRLVLLHETAKEEAQDGRDKEVDSHSAIAGQSRRPVSNALNSYLERQTKEQLVALLEELAGRYEAVRKALEDRLDLANGRASTLVEAIRAEILELSAKPGWTDHWGDAGYIPDYSQVRSRKEALLAGGHTDEVVALGKELLKLGAKQVEASEDGGETAEEIGSCLDVVFRALPRSSLSPTEQMLWAVEAELSDHYDLCKEGTTHFWKQEHAVTDWSALAETLGERLGLILRRQDKPQVYARNGPAVLAVRREVLLEKGELYGENCRPLVMSPDDSIDVDTTMGLALVEFLLYLEYAGYL